MANYTFEQLPAIVGRIEDKLDNIEAMLLENNSVNYYGKDILSIKEASDLLNLTVSTLYSKVSRKEIPVSKKGKSLYFSRIDLLNWIKSGKKKTHEEISKEFLDSRKNK